MTKIEEIYAYVLPEMEDNDIEDTTQNRIWFLEGLRDGWKEDSGSSIEKSLYMIALVGELACLRIKNRFN